MDSTDLNIHYNHVPGNGGGSCTLGLPLLQRWADCAKLQGRGGAPVRVRL